VIKKQSINTYM